MYIRVGLEGCHFFSNALTLSFHVCKQNFKYILHLSKDLIVLLRISQNNQRLRMKGGNIPDRMLSLYRSCFIGLSVYNFICVTFCVFYFIFVLPLFDLKKRRRKIPFKDFSKNKKIILIFSYDSINLRINRSLFTLYLLNNFKKHIYKHRKTMFAVQHFELFCNQKNNYGSNTEMWKALLRRHALDSTAAAGLRTYYYSHQSTQYSLDPAVDVRVTHASKLGRHASAVLAVALCLCVSVCVCRSISLKSVFYRNDFTSRAGCQPRQRVRSSDWPCPSQTSVRLFPSENETIGNEANSCTDIKLPYTCWQHKDSRAVCHSLTAKLT